MEPRDKTKAFEMLAAKGMVKAVVSFSGGNDEGGVDQIVMYATLDPDAEGVELPCFEPGGYTYNGETGKWDVPVNPTVTPDQKLAEILETPVDETYGSFAGDFQVDGIVTWNVAEQSVTMVFDESVESYQSHTESF